MNIRVCADCRHYEANPHTSASSNVDFCKRPGAAWATIDLVRGNNKPAFAEIERTGTTKPGACGPAGTHWEPNMGMLNSVDEEEDYGHPV